MPVKGFRKTERFRRCEPPEGAPAPDQCVWCLALGIKPGDEIVTVNDIKSVRHGQALRENMTACGHFFSLTELELEFLG